MRFIVLVNRGKGKIQKTPKVHSDSEMKKGELEQGWNINALVFLTLTIISKCKELLEKRNIKYVVFTS